MLHYRTLHPSASPLPKVDDALPIRKLCLSCVESILHNLPSQLDALAVLQLSAVLLTDHDDIKLLYLQVLYE
ncbi:hypothetical protein EON65_35930 [archaeon]|nr:MAG: hypothetical protein EON65_35930 [archaeon]